MPYITAMNNLEQTEDIKRLEDRITALEERWKDHPDYVRRGPTEAEWSRGVDESWAWFSEKLGRTPSSYDVQMWIDGYAPRA
jgi:hypothetical protein